MKRDSHCCAIDIYCIAALTSLSDSVSYVTFLFSEWRIEFRHDNAKVEAQVQTWEHKIIFEKPGLATLKSYQ